jgi:hypothetical protein
VAYPERAFRANVFLPEGTRTMITAEQVLERRRLLILDDQVRLDPLTRDLDENEDRWINDFISKLAGVIGNIGRRK